MTTTTKLIIIIDDDHRFISFFFCFMVCCLCLSSHGSLPINVIMVLNGFIYQSRLNFDVFFIYFQILFLNHISNTISDLSIACWWLFFLLLCWSFTISISRNETIHSIRFIIISVDHVVTIVWIYWTW